MQPDFATLKPVQAQTTDSSQPDFASLKPAGTSTTTPTPTPTNTPDNQGVFGKIDSTLSDMPGVLGAVGSGIYNSAKGLLKLGGSAAVDAFDAINHPIDSGKALLSFLGGELTGGADPNSLDTLGQFVQGTVGSKGLLGVAQLPGKAVNEIGSTNDQINNEKYIGMLSNMAGNYKQQANAATNPEDQQKFQKAYEDTQKLVEQYNNATPSEHLTQGNILGTVLNGALTALLFGSGNIAANAVEKSVVNGLITPAVGQTLKTIVTSAPGVAAQSGGIMTGFQAGSNLQDNKPVTDNLKQAFFSGLALPTVLKTAGAVTGAIGNKVIPSSLSADSGATMLKNAIGFRGNIKEKPQFDSAAPIVFNELKNNGFKLTDSTDPNNIINLDKGISDSMSKILQERTARIQATGGDATISGDLAAKAIRNLVEPGSVEDLTNPAVRDRLDAIAKNFEGKQYSPVDAQKAIVQANSGFSLSDNPAMSSQIKMAISKAFTPELDRIVAGKDAIQYDAKGKPIPAPKGTAELNKRWSALKSFSDQLQKKMNIEDRKASVSLPSRLTGAQIAGKVGEAVGNPMLVAQKGVGASFEYLANKLMGDRNNVNYRIYKAFNGQPIANAIIGMFNKFTKAGELVTLLKQNPLLAHVLEKVIPITDQLKENVNAKLNATDSKLQAKNANIPGKNGGYVTIGSKIIREVPEATKKEMIQVIDYLRNGTQFKDAEGTVSRLAQKYNINENWSNSKIADKFEDLVDGTKTSQASNHPVISADPLIQEANKK